MAPTIATMKNGFRKWRDGWIVPVNFREHVAKEMNRFNLDYYTISGGELSELNWRNFLPQELFKKIDGIIRHRLVS